MLEHDRLKPLRADLRRRTVPSLGADSDASSAAHIARGLGNVQAAFTEELLPFTVGGTERARDLFGLFDDTVARLTTGMAGGAGARR